MVCARCHALAQHNYTKCEGRLPPLSYTRQEVIRGNEGPSCINCNPAGAVAVQVPSRLSPCHELRQGSGRPVCCVAIGVGPSVQSIVLSPSGIGYRGPDITCAYIKKGLPCITRVRQVNTETRELQNLHEATTSTLSLLWRGLREGVGSRGLSWSTDRPPSYRGACRCREIITFPLSRRLSTR